MADVPKWHPDAWRKQPANRRWDLRPGAYRVAASGRFENLRAQLTGYREREQRAACVLNLTTGDWELRVPA